MLEKMWQARAKLEEHLRHVLDYTHAEYVLLQQMNTDNDEEHSVMDDDTDYDEEYYHGPCDSQGDAKRQKFDGDAEDDMVTLEDPPPTLEDPPPPPPTPPPLEPENAPVGNAQTVYSKINIVFYIIIVLRP